MKNSSSCSMCADWFLRVAIAIVFLTAGITKVTVMGVEGFAQMFNLPLFLAWLVVLGELGSAAGIIVGGFLKNGLGDKLTRFCGVVVVIIMIGVIVVAKAQGFEKGILMGIGGMYDVITLIALGSYFMLKGNGGEHA